MTHNERHKCDRKHYRVITRNVSHSAFNGYKERYSKYSTIICLKCGHCWRSKASYVPDTPNYSREEEANYNRGESIDPKET